MPYGTIKVDTITFTSGSSDVSIPISGLVQNPTFTGNVTVTGTISGTTVRGDTVSGATVTGTAGQFGTLTGNTAGFTTVTGATVTGTTANFVTVSGTTVTGTTANFATVSGTTTTGTDARFTNVTGVNIIGTTQVSGATVTGTNAQFTNVTGVTIIGTTTVSGATVTGTTASFAGTATASGFVPTGSGVPTNGLYLPSGNTVGISTSGSYRLSVDNSGRVLINTQVVRNNLYNAGYTPRFQYETVGSSLATRGFCIAYNSNGDTGGPLLQLLTARGNTAGSNTIVATGDELGGIAFMGTDGFKPLAGAGITAYAEPTIASGTVPGRLDFFTTKSGNGAPTRRFSLGPTGSFLFETPDAVGVGTMWNTRNLSGDQVLTLANGPNANNTSSYYLVCQEPNVANRCFIYGNGNIANTNNSYGALSDIKLKDNIADAGSQWDDIKALKVRYFNFKENSGYQTHRQIGVIAQEIEQVSPGLVYETPDLDAENNDLGTVTKSVNYSVLYMKAIKALQEAIEKIEILEDKVAALEAQ